MHPHHELTSDHSGGCREAITVAALCFAFLGCDVGSERTPVGPSRVVGAASGIMSIEADPFIGPAPGHAWMLTTASGSVVAPVGQGAEPLTAVSRCGIEWNYRQSVHIHLPPPCTFGGCTGQPRGVLTTSEIPPGVHRLTIVTYCPPDNVYDVDFSRP